MSIKPEPAAAQPSDTIRLYQFPPSGNSHKVRLMLSLRKRPSLPDFSRNQQERRHHHECTPRTSAPALPPFTRQAAIQKVRLAEDAWNSRDPVRVSLAYTPDSRWHNRSEFPQGRAQIVELLRRNWARELDYRHDLADHKGQLAGHQSYPLCAASDAGGLLRETGGRPSLARMRLFFALCWSSHRPSSSISGGM